ncbi:CDP-glucose 4,6-dehydratase [Microbacterium ulmi]|uniref:CDP-glucose 4,6-dehydratase n=1 Tax=Microbacterium ulmi TaxID=179095 RepID=A0A7Y2PZG6_9MICO|nr:CDP-glucose 4,6-dehydratase [Microbacterium ulmi]NII69748.1 CDP-glucose 4,6-dehydratase [Microbacterium ulmi]NNH03278.1 CDP-glucose 4,6-dehydratase [Microbacterium ulmi]
MHSEYWHGRAVFVTGHTGFKGAWLTVLLHRLGARLHGYALPTPDDFLFQRAGLRELLEQDVRGDIRDGEGVAEAIAASGAQVVLHLAAQSIVRESYATPRDTFSVNVDGTLSVLEAARSVESVDRVVVVTTDKVYRNNEWPWGYRELDPLGGDDPYSASKAACELATHSFAVSFPRERFAVASARAGNVIGGGDATPDALIPELIAGFAERRPARLRRPRATRPWQHVLEPLSGYLTLAESLDASRHDTAWNFGPAAEDGLTVGGLADEAARLWGEGASWIDEDDGGPHEAGLLMVDSAKARADLGWRPALRVPEAIALTVEWEQRVRDGATPLAVTQDQVDHYLAKAGVA